MKINSFSSHWPTITFFINTLPTEDNINYTITQSSSSSTTHYQPSLSSSTHCQLSTLSTEDYHPQHYQPITVFNTIHSMKHLLYQHTIIRKSKSTTLSTKYCLHQLYTNSHINHHIHHQCPLLHYQWYGIRSNCQPQNCLLVDNPEVGNSEYIHYSELPTPFIIVYLV